MEIKGNWLMFEEWPMDSCDRLLRLARRACRLLRILPFVLLLPMSGGCLFTGSLNGIINDRCHYDTVITDRWGEVSEDSFTIYIKGHIDSYRNPFKKTMKTKDFQEKYEYSLTKPSKGAKKGQWLLVTDENRDRIISLTSLEIKNGEQDGITCSPNLPNAYYKSVDWKHLILPVAEPYSLFNDSKRKYLLMKAKSQIHPDDIPYLQKPFLIDEYRSHYYKLAIPYKSKNGILYFYVTKDSSQSVNAELPFIQT